MSRVEGVPPDGKSRLPERSRAVWWLLLAFAAINVVILWAADPSCRQVHGDCSIVTDRNGFMVAEALLQHGALVDPADPTTPYTAHVPGHALMMAATFALFGAESYLPLVLLQLSLLFASGLLLHWVANRALPGSGALAMALLLFNPNVLAQVHLVSASAVELPFVMGAFSAVFAFGYQPGLLLALAAGASIGLAMLMRQLGQYLAVLLPFGLCLLVWLNGQSFLWRRAFFWGLLGSLLAVGMAAPWALHMHNAGLGWRMTPPSHEHLVLVDSYKYLSPETPGQPDAQLKIDFLAQEEVALRAARPDWEDLTEAQRGALRHDYVVTFYSSLPFDAATFTRALAWSWGRFLLSGGEGELHRLFGLEGAAGSDPIPFYGLKMAALIFVLGARVVGLLGLLEMLRRREWRLLVLCIGLVLLFMAGTFMVGQPRYRLPIEPQLMLFTTFGVYFVRSMRARQIAPSAVVAHPADVVGP